VTYAQWISAYVQRCGGPHGTLGRCKSAAEEMAVAFPELRVVRGHVECPEPWRRRGHWWCETAADEIVDPTAAQFACGILWYEKYRDGDPVRLGTCMDCGAPLWGPPDRGRQEFCGQRCRDSYAAYLNGGAL
jgi:hypothetical protein